MTTSAVHTNHKTTVIYQIFWQSKQTGYKGNGEPKRYESKTDVDSLITQSNQKHPTIHHWAVQVPQPTGSAANLLN